MHIMSSLGVNFSLFIWQIFLAILRNHDWPFLANFRSYFRYFKFLDLAFEGESTAGGTLTYKKVHG